MKTHIDISIEFDLKEIDYIISGALEGGSNYWIGKPVKIKNGDAKGAEFASECVSKGGTIIITEDCNEVGCDFVDHELTKEKILEGLRLYAQQSGELDFDNMDAGDYDMILQYALFGELKYS